MTVITKENQEREAVQKIAICNGVTFAGVKDPPQQIMNWNCYVCGMKCATFEDYRRHICGRVAA